MLPDVSSLQIYDDNSELGIKATNKTPFVWFMQNGELTITGRSIPEDGSEFFKNIFEWVENYIVNPSPSTVLSVELEYLNDITSKYLLRIINSLNTACGNFRVEWRYEQSDEDMLELGQILYSSSCCRFEFIEINTK